MTIVNLISYAFSIIVLGLIVYQDYSKRMIHIILFPLLSIILIFPHFFHSNIHLYFLNILVNISFVIITFMLLFLYVSLRNRKFTNFINKQIGLGDLLILCSLCFWGNSTIFIWLFVISIVFSLILSLLILNKKKGAIRSSYHIPLAAHVSLFWIAFLSVNYFYSALFVQFQLPL